MKKEDLKQIKEVVEEVVGKRITTAEARINKNTDNRISQAEIRINKNVDEKIEGLARITKNSFDKVDERFNRLEKNNKRDHHELRKDIEGIDRRLRAETESLDEHDLRLKILEKTI